MALTSSPTRYRLAVLAVLVVVAVLIAWAGAPGAIALVFAALFAFSVRDRLLHRVVVLAREGEQLTGTALRGGEPLWVSETTFALEPDRQGSWLIVLRAPGRSVRISPGGLGVTKTSAEQALLAMGLTRQDHPRT
ncbi:hypothetical protein [Solirubrobacter soli]|uniref:hypothetical protein n=1 Tax=Solirubrobacter soli TaxID=363832 RepID=UPI000411806E|nr:hypothetical protein [Solirubrobacter soli]